MSLFNFDGEAVRKEEIDVAQEKIDACLKSPGFDDHVSMCPWCQYCHSTVGFLKMMQHFPKERDIHDVAMLYVTRFRPDMLIHLVELKRQWEAVSLHKRMLTEAMDDLDDEVDELRSKKEDFMEEDSEDDKWCRCGECRHVLASPKPVLQPFPPGPQFDSKSSGPHATNGPRDPEPCIFLHVRRVETTPTDIPEKHVHWTKSQP